MTRQPLASQGDKQEGGSFGRLLRSLRVSAGLSQFDLSERSGVSVKTISDLERGRRATPHASSARMLADGLGLEGDRRVSFFEVVTRGRRLGNAASGRHYAPAQQQAEEPGAIIGRADDLDAIERRLDAGDRVLTLLGPGGVGKTRLARAIANRRPERSRTVWVPLDAVTDPGNLLSAVARAAGASEQGTGSLLERIAAALSGDFPLLVLDNVEHLLAAAPDLAALLDAIPALRVLVTTREPLRLAEERILPISPLALPDPLATRADLVLNPAVALFLRSLAAASPDRAATRSPEDADADLAHAAAIVRLLDGLPLAIELAAAQGVTLPLSSIAALLETRGLDALARGRRDAPARLQTMQAAIGWSADLLPAPAQRLLRLLGAFRGGFTVEAVLAVAASLGEPDLVASLPALAEAQFIQPDPARPGRLRMLEPIRMYAEDRLRASGEDPAARAAHAAAYLRWARDQARLVAGPDPLPALDAIDDDLANVLAALAAAVQPVTADLPAALQTAANLSQYWEVRARYREGRSAIAAAIAAAMNADGPDAPSSVPLLEALYISGYLAYMQGDLPALQRARDQLRPLAATAGIPEHQTLLACLDVFAGDLAGIAYADLLPPIRAAHAAVAGFDHRVAWQTSLVLTANLMVECGDLEGALPLLHAYAEWAARRGATIHARGASSWLGLTLLQLGRPAEARQRLIDALEGSTGARAIVQVVNMVLGIAIADSGPDASIRLLTRAARLHGAFDAASERYGYSLTAMQAQMRADSRARIAATLGDLRFETLTGEGRDLAPDAVLDLARS